MGTQSSKRAVIFSYSQTGQLTDTVRAFTEPLVAAGWHIRHVPVTPARPYPFPWPIGKFFGVFPDSVDEQAAIELDTSAPWPSSEPDELVILAYQVWFLAPSLPMRTLLNAHPEVFADREVLSVIACRNMWYSAAVEVDRRLRALGATHLGAVVATDTRPQFVTLVTTLRWLLGGKREAHGVFGRAGVDQRELDRIRNCGTAWAAGDPDVSGTEVAYPIAGADLLAGRIFRRWGRLIRAASRRGAVVRAATSTAFVLWLGVSLALMPLGALLALPMHRRIDRAIDKALAGSTLRQPESSSAASEQETARIFQLSGAEYVLLFDAQNESTWRDAVGYVRMMDTTPLSAVAVSRDREHADSILADPSGKVLAAYGIDGATAVLLRPDAFVAAVLPGTDPHQELIRAIRDATSDDAQTTSSR